MVPWSQLRREIIQSFFRRHAWKQCRLNFARKEPAVSLVKFDVGHSFTFFARAFSVFRPERAWQAADSE